MPDHISARLVTITLRVLPLALKAVLTLYMARYLGLSATGIYGLLTSAVYVGGILLGLGFTQHSQRAAVGMHDRNVMLLWRTQTLLGLATYTMLGLLAWAATAMGVLDIPLLGLCVVIICLEHYVASTNMLQIAQHRPVAANLCLFLSSGLWVPFVVGLGLAYPTARTLDVILLGWLAGLMLNILVTLGLWRHWDWALLLRSPLNRAEVGHGIRQAFPLWIGLLALAMGSWMERVYIQHFLGLEILGAFTVFWSFCNAAQTLVTSGVMNFQLPPIIQAARQRDWLMFRQLARHTWGLTALAGGAILTAGMLGLWLIVPLMQQPLLDASLPLGMVILASMLPVMLGDATTQVLYALHKDKVIWGANLGTLVYRLGMIPLGLTLFGFWGIALSRWLEALGLLAFRVQAVRRYLPASTL